MSTSPFSNRKSSGLWCRIAAGKIVRSATEETPGAVQVEKKRNGQGTGEYRWELHDDAVSGRIIRFEQKTDNWNGEDIQYLILGLHHKASDTIINIQFKEGDRYWRALMYRLTGIDLSKEITLAPYDFEPKEGGRRIGMNVLQDEEKIPASFTKDDPNGLPEMEWVTFKGKKRADFTKQDAWLNGNVLRPTADRLTALLVTSMPIGEPSDSDDANEEDDLPF